MAVATRASASEKAELRRKEFTKPAPVQVAGHWVAALHPPHGMFSPSRITHTLENQNRRQVALRQPATEVALRQSRHVGPSFRTRVFQHGHRGQNRGVNACIVRSLEPADQVLPISVGQFITLLHPIGDRENGVLLG
ncbi:MAG: hypothetical protein SNJ61_06900 [Fimbriimonadaceae bacterium]